MNIREVISNKKRIVFKLGTSTLTYPNGRLRLEYIERLALVLTDICNRNKDVVLVTSGAIAVGAGKMGLKKKPTELAAKQALAAIGQAQLMKIYQRSFNMFSQGIAQVLLTRDIVEIEKRRTNAKNTLLTLFDMGIIPIINENDTVSTDEIEFGDNDTLSANVADLIDADLLILLTDIDALYTADPKEDPNAIPITLVKDITPEIEALASGAGSAFGTGGMSTKITAAKICRDSGIDTLIVNGNDPRIIYNIFEGKEIGTLFANSSEIRSLL